MVKEIVVRKAGTDGIFATGSFRADKMLTIGSSVRSSIQIEEMEPEQLVLVYEDGVPYLLNRGESVTFNGESLSSGGKAVIKDESMITVYDYEISFRSEDEDSDPDNLYGGDFFFVVTEKGSTRMHSAAESMWFGQTAGEFCFTKNKKGLSEVFCRVGFDWSGATLFPRRSRKTHLNGTELIDPTPLRQGDQITFLGTALLNEDIVCVFNDEVAADDWFRSEERNKSEDEPEFDSSGEVTEIEKPSSFSVIEIALLIAGLVFASLVAFLLYFLI